MRTMWIRGRVTAQLAVLAVTALGAAAGTANASIDWHVTINDPENAYTSLHSTIEETTLAAGADWGRYIAGDGAVHVEVRFDNVPTANGNVGWVGDHVGTADGIGVYEMGPQSAIRQGLAFDPNRTDIIITMGYDWMDNWLWWDPNPYSRSADVPGDSLDAYSTTLHELGHGLGFIGYRDWETGTLSTNHQSTYDQWVVMDDNGFPWFTGPAASEVYGGAVPLTQGNLMHYGNDSPDPGHELAGVGLMNGVYSPIGGRWHIEPLDVAFLEDMGYAVVPEPAAAGIFLAGTLCLLGRRRRAA